MGPTETGDPALEPIHEKIADEPRNGNAQYWIERLAFRAESIIDLTVGRLVELDILEYHDEVYGASGVLPSLDVANPAQEGGPCPAASPL